MIWKIIKKNEMLFILVPCLECRWYSLTEKGKMYDLKNILKNEMLCILVPCLECRWCSGQWALAAGRKLKSWFAYDREKSLLVEDFNRNPGLFCFSREQETPQYRIPVPYNEFSHVGNVQQVGPPPPPVYIRTVDIYEQITRHGP